MEMYPQPKYSIDDREMVEELLQEAEIYTWGVSKRAVVSWLSNRVDRMRDEDQLVIFKGENDGN